MSILLSLEMSRWEKLVKEILRPYDEDDRLAALSKLNLISGDSAERFDRIVRIAQRIFALPYADFSLMDTNDQIMVSKSGYTQERISRDVSLANQALCKGDVFVIPDTLEDDRFSGFPIVVSPPKIRFYAGLPIRNSAAIRIGVLSIAGREPRAFGAQDQSVLRDLGEMISNELAFLDVAQFDRLTQLSINDGFFSLAQQGLRVCEREKNPAVVVAFNVKRASTPNDPDIGSEFENDRHIRVFANKLRHFFRKSDIIGRLGLEEFAVLLLNSSTKNVDEIVMKLQAAIDAHNADFSSRVKISFSNGSASFDPEHPITSNALVAMASRSLQQLAKVV